MDALFRSAAEAHGRRVVGVVLSGTRGDGTVGLAAVKASGGATIVQDPAEALHAGMPLSALAHVAVDAIVPSELVAATIVAMVNGEEPPAGARRSEGRVDPAMDDRPSTDPSITVCPECGGVLSERLEAGIPVWACRVGHRYSQEGLVDAQSDSIEAALWIAIRALEDRARLLERMASQSETQGMVRSARSFRQRAAASLEQAHAVREALTRATAVNLARLDQEEADAIDSGGESS